MIYADLTEYVGEFKNNMFHGQGIYKGKTHHY